MKKARPDKVNYYLGIAEAVAQRATCLRRKYGAIIVKNDEVISTGYCGAPRGIENCCDRGVCQRQEMQIPAGERYELCLAGETVVKLLDGSYKSIKQLAEESASNFWVYAVNPKTGEIVPALAYDARQTGVRHDIYEVTFDNGKTLRCTGNHPIMLRDCTFKEVKDLCAGESVMPMYYNFAHNGGYESISNTVNARKEKMQSTWKCNTYQTPTHKMVYDFFSDFDCKHNELVHHKDECILNNVPSNLEKLDRGEHSKHHLEVSGTVNNIAKYAKQGNETFVNNLKDNPEKLRKRSELGALNMSRNWENPEYRDKIRPTQIENGKQTALKTNKDPECIRKRCVGKVLKGISLLSFLVQDQNLTSDNYTIMREKVQKGNNSKKIPSETTVLKYFNTLEEAIEQSKYYNHKVVSVKLLDLEIPVYDLTVPVYENFAIDLGDNSCVFVHNCRSVHAEQNAIISAARKDMEGATIYLVGIDAQTGKLLQKSEPCLLCKKMILNSGITTVVMRNGDKDYAVEEVAMWRVLSNI